MIEHYGEKEDERKTIVYIYQTTIVIYKYAKEISNGNNEQDKGEHMVDSCLDDNDDEEDDDDDDDDDDCDGEDDDDGDDDDDDDDDDCDDEDDDGKSDDDDDKDDDVDDDDDYGIYDDDNENDNDVMILMKRTKIPMRDNACLCFFLLKTTKCDDNI